MKLHFLTYYTPDEPYKSMAQRLCNTARQFHPGCITHGLPMPGSGKGRDMYAEALGGLYWVFSNWLSDGPVVLIDADCYFQASIEPFLAKQKDWDIAAIYRGRHMVNSYGPQSFLGSIVIFNNERPNVCRKFWLEWAAGIYDFAINPRPEPEVGVGPHNDMYAERGWTRTWYSDQATLSLLLDTRLGLAGAWEKKVRQVDRTLFLDRNLFAAKPGNADAFIIHEKGGGKLR